MTERAVTIDGELQTSAGESQLRFVRAMPHTPLQVWKALTEPEHLKAWFPTEIHGDRTAGAALRFEFRNGEGPTIDGRMIEYDAPSLLEFAWGDDETLRFALEPDGEGTVLTFVNTFHELGKAARDAAGWQSCLDGLTRHLNGAESHPNSREQWQRYYHAYIARFGPSASTIGPPSAGP